MNRPTLRVRFCDFWKPYDRPEQYFRELLGRHYILDESHDPDLIIYAPFGEEHLNYTCVRVFYSGENLRPNWFECDYAIGFDYPTKRNIGRYLRFPLWAIWDDPRSLLRKPLAQDKQAKNFCCMVVSNGRCAYRNRFFEQLCQYKQVDSGGKYSNNVGGPVVDKRAFVSQYKFTLAFENSEWVGYTTEKLVDAMSVGSIPIYWGNPKVGDEFNTKSFISLYDYPSCQAAIRQIQALDEDAALYSNVLAQPWYVNNMLPNASNPQRLLDFFEKIVRAIHSFLPVAKGGINPSVNITHRLARIIRVYSRAFHTRSLSR